MKKLISILLVVVMLVAMVPAMAFTTSADTTATTPSGSWADSGNYDLSWAESLIVEEIPSKVVDTTTGATALRTDECAIVNGTIYLCKYVSATYVIDTPKKLAGVAVIANASNIETFSGTTFKITADIDLGAHYWEPIANTTAKKFRGLITAETETVISNMTIVDTSTSVEDCYGLIGAQGSGMNSTGAISNITLENAYINVKTGRVGSFVGYLNHGGTEYKNLKSDATIICSSGINSDTGKYNEFNHAWNIVGGIFGQLLGTAAQETFTSCVFTGSIDAPTAGVVGGIAGGTRISGAYVLNLNKCVVAADYIRYGAYRPGGASAWWGACGGLIGIALKGTSGTINASECYVGIGEYTIYKEQNATGGQDCTAGVIGNYDCPVNLTNCQVDVSSTGDYGNHHATFVGRAMSSITFTSCVNTGVIARNAGAGYTNNNTYAWSARGITATDGGNNFATFYQPYVHNGSVGATTIESVDTWKNALDSNIWSERDGSIYPILTVAKDYAEHSVSGAGVDYSFFDINECKVVSVEELKALDYIIQGNGAGRNSVMGKVSVSPALATADMTGFSANSVALINAKLGVAADVDDGTVFNMDADKIFAQVALEANVDDASTDANEAGTYNIRFVILINDKTACDGVTFDVAGSRGDTFGATLTSDVVTKCYKTVIEVTSEGNVTHTADGDAYYVICVLKNVDLSEDTTFTVRANAVKLAEDGVTVESVVTQSTAVNYTVAAR